MSDQQNLFSDKICSVCGEDPGYREDNPFLWNGIFDGDTNELVCWNCQNKHYSAKSETESCGLYSEYPVMAIGGIIGSAQ